MDSNENSGTKENRSRAGGRRDVQSRFLAAYARCGNISQAAAEAGISRSTHHVWLKKDEKYREAFESAVEDLNEQMEEEVWRRAVKGKETPVFYQGVQCGTICHYSDQMLMKLLKALRPEKYGDKPCRQSRSQKGAIIIEGCLNPEVYGPE